MANLVSPGVQVTITDESVYGPTGTGTVPMMFIATGEDKVDPTGTTTTAAQTAKSKAGKPVLVTSQRELTQNFGNVDFRKVGGSVVQGDETNEYGLLAAYSFLGQSSAAYIVRADVDLTTLRPQSAAPTGPAANNTYWVNPSKSNFGLYTYTANGWVAVTPTVEITDGSAPSAAVVTGGYLVAVAAKSGTTEIEYYKEASGAWATAAINTFAPHYSEPSSPSVGDEWVKTTTPGSGFKLDVSKYTTAAGSFVSQPIQYADDNAPDGTTSDIFHNGATATARTLQEGDLWLDHATDELVLKVYASGAWANIVVTASATQPTGTPVNGRVWHDGDINELAIYEVASDSGTQKWKRVQNIAYATSAPAVGSAGDYWIDTDAAGYPLIYRSNGSAWVVKDNSDQSTSNGVVFGDITANATALGGFENTLLAGAANPLLHPVGTTGINMCRSGGTVRKYDTSLTTTWKWRNHAPNQADGSGSFGRHAQRAVVVAAMQASASASEILEDTVAFSLIAAPGYPEMTDEMVTINSNRNETGFVIIDAPLRVSPTEAVNWVNGVGVSANGESGLATKNTYSAVYYPHALTTNPATGDNVVAPASHIALYTYAYSDNVSFQWFSPAGLTRGQVQNASSVGYLDAEDEFKSVSLTQGNRDTMYAAKMNPIARFPAEGVVVFGQKTLHPSASALDRVNVARLTAYLRERFAVIARPFLFEPNDAATRRNAKGAFDGFLQGILSSRGVYDFAVVCDETNNTPARIDANEFWIDVAIEPTKSAEFIYIPIRIVNTGELS
tara:strand:+ start:139 stop:2493 length:2355 start_codon:yes stop_codon:yes gene_type:complete